MKPKVKRLTEREKKFCEHVARGMTLVDAAAEAGYKARNNGTLRKMACVMRKKPHIDEYIASRTSDEIITTDEILTGIRDIALNTGEKASDRLRAYELLGKNKAIFTEKQDVTLTGDMGVRLILPEDDDSDG